MAGCSSKDACGGCAAAQICDAATKSCQPAIALGQPCTSAEGQPLAMPCEEGTVCETALTPAVCGQSCNPAATQSGCPKNDQCLTPVDDAGAPVLSDAGVPLGFCGGLVDAGQPCGVVGLSVCNSGLSCVLFSPDAVDGVCFMPCDPQSGAATCPAPTHCLAVFADPTQGICWTSVAPGAPCAEAELAFCPAGQLCLGSGEGEDGGSCWVRCTPGDAGVCPVEGEACVAPTADPAVGVCAEPVAAGGACDPPAGLFCDTDDFCITQEDGGSICHQGCTDGEACPPGQSCLPISGGDGQMACG
jgi:hypothetical protein